MLVYGVNIWEFAILAEQCYSASKVDAEQKRRLDTVEVGGRWVPGEREGGDGGKVSKMGGNVNGKPIPSTLRAGDRAEVDPWLYAS